MKGIMPQAISMRGDGKKDTYSEVGKQDKEVSWWSVQEARYQLKQQLYPTGDLRELVIHEPQRFSIQKVWMSI